MLVGQDEHCQWSVLEAGLPPWLYSFTGFQEEAKLPNGSRKSQDEAQVFKWFQGVPKRDPSTFMVHRLMAGVGGGGELSGIWCTGEAADLLNGRGREAC